MGWRFERTTVSQTCSQPPAHTRACLLGLGQGFSELSWWCPGPPSLGGRQRASLGQVRALTPTPGSQTQDRPCAAPHSLGAPWHRGQHQLQPVLHRRSALFRWLRQKPLGRAAAVSPLQECACDCQAEGSGPPCPCLPRPLYTPQQAALSLKASSLVLPHACVLPGLQLLPQLKRKE